MLVIVLVENLEERLCLLEVDMDWYLSLLQKGRRGIPLLDIDGAVELVAGMTSEVSTVAVAVIMAVAVNATARSGLESHQEVVGVLYLEGKVVLE